MTIQGTDYPLASPDAPCFGPAVRGWVQSANGYDAFLEPPIATTRQHIKQLQRFLRAPDPEVVYQGIILAQSLGEPAIYDALLEGTRLLESATVIDKVPFTSIVPGRRLLSPKRTLNLRVGAVLALIADAPPGVAVADRIRPRLTRLILHGGKGGQAGLWQPRPRHRPAPARRADSAAPQPPARARDPRPACRADPPQAPLPARAASPVCRGSPRSSSKASAIVPDSVRNNDRGCFF
ncbi:MAG: hypothetical protein ACI8RZ_005596 [Myxococcota bacterium]|jgi:hypothetical protein